MLVKISGKIIGHKIISPKTGQNFKPHQMIQILQEGKTFAGVCFVRDYDLNRKYNGVLEANALITSYVDKKNTAQLSAMVI